jgi:large subunit ribosomal protein L30
MHAAVQLRGRENVGRETRDTLEMLNLHRVNHATLVPDTDAYRGMLAKVNDFVAYGEPSTEVVATLLRRRAEPAEGEEAVTDEWVAEHTDHEDVAALAAALADEETTLREAGLSPVLRLHPPRGGHGGVKHPRGDGGQLGRHDTAEMDALLEAMR